MAVARKRFFITAWILPTLTKLCRQALRLPLSGSANVDRENELAIKIGECSLSSANTAAQDFSLPASRLSFAS
jgi:hypothetical protein